MYSRFLLLLLLLPPSSCLWAVCQLKTTQALVKFDRQGRACSSSGPQGITLASRASEGRVRAHDRHSLGPSGAILFTYSLLCPMGITERIYDTSLTSNTLGVFVRSVLECPTYIGIKHVCHRAVRCHLTARPIGVVGILSSRDTYIYIYIYI